LRIDKEKNKIETGKWDKSKTEKEMKKIIKIVKREIQ
jgi:hypothetical protein